MQLFFTLTSPYARKCNMVLRATSLIEETELVICDQFAEEFRAINPLGKIPALRDGDLCLVDSPLICEYLDHVALSKGLIETSLFRKNSAEYFSIQKTHALADGIVDAAVASVYEKRRETEPSEYWLARWRASLEASVRSLQLKDLAAEQLHIGSIATLTALAYLDFRLNDLNWRQWNSDVAEWYAPLTELSWFKDTQPA